MNIRNRETLQLNDIHLLNRKVTELIDEFEKNDESKLIFQSIFAKKSKQKQLLDKLNKIIIEVNEEQESLTQNEIFEKYIQLLRLIKNFMLDEKNDETLTKKMKYFLIDELKVLEEANWESQSSKKEQIRRSFSQLEEAVLYDSADHQAFCKKWKVVGNIEDYIHWNEFIETINGQYSELQKGYYAKIVSLLLQKFDLKEKVKIVDASDKAYSQFQFGLDEVVNIEKKEKLAVSSLKNEIEIWRPDNLVTVFVDYVKQHFGDLNLPEVNDLGIEIKIIISRILKEFINPVRETFGLPQLEVSDIDSAKNQFDAEIKKLKLAQIELKSSQVEIKMETNINSNKEIQQRESHKLLNPSSSSKEDHKKSFKAFFMNLFMPHAKENSADSPKKESKSYSP